MNIYQNPYLNPFGFPQPMQPQAQPAPQQVVRVNGENGARTYQIGANSSAMLLDESGKMVWLVTSDGAGYKTVNAYDITPHQTVPAPDFGSLESRIKRLEETVNGITADSSAAEQRKHVTDGAARPADAGRGAFSAEPAAGAQPAYHESPADEAGDGRRTKIWR